jgi:hypothetical protein
MYDIINDKCEQENPDIILRRFEQQVKDRLQEKDIIALSISVHSFVLKWGLIWPRPDEIDDPYAYLEHALDIARPKARAYFYIGHAVSEHRECLSGDELYSIKSPYMLPYIDKALRWHVFQDVKSALMSMSFREFRDYAEQKPVVIPLSETAKLGSNSSNDSTLRKGRQEKTVSKLRSCYDDGLEVYVVGVRNDEQWQRIKAKLSQIARELNNPVEMYSAENESEAEDISAA